MKFSHPVSRLLALLGIAALLVSAVSASRAWPPTPEATAAPKAIPSPAVVCLGYVDLEQGVASLAPLRPGRVAELLVREGDAVAAGTALLRLDDSEARLQVAEAQVALDTAQNQLTKARTLPEQHRAQVEQQLASGEAAEHRLEAARSLLARKRHLQKAQQVSTEEVAAAEGQVQELEAAARAEAAKLAELRLHDPAADVRKAELAVSATQAKLDQARHALEECKLKAPSAGSVLRVLVGPGDVLSGQGGQAAVLFAPEGPRLVRAEIDQEFAGRVAAGQPAVVEDDAPSGAHWTGRVLRLADWYHQQRTILKEPSLRPDARTVECLITLDPGQSAPRLGQRVRVTLGG